MILGRHGRKIRAKKEKCPIFPGLSKGILPNSPQMVWRPLIVYIFLDQKFLSVKKKCGGNLKKMHLETILPPNSQL